MVEEIERQLIKLPEEFLTSNPLYLLAKHNPDVFMANYNELRRQRDGLEMIASENFVSESVLGAVWSVLTNKYAEGYPGGKYGGRYYGGCEFIDVVEALAIERGRRLFSTPRCNAEYVNPQPHSGSQANQAAFMAVMSPGDKILSMKLDHGGHLSHGLAFNDSGQKYQAVSYGVGSTGLLDYDNIRDIARRERPDVIVAGGSAYPGKIDFREFRQIADEVGAWLIADMAHIAGLVVAGLHQSPIGYAHITTTTTHKTLRGPRGGLIIIGEGDHRLMVEKKVDRRYPMKLWKAVRAAVFPGMQGGPLEHIIAAKAVALGEAGNEDSIGANPGFIAYQQQTIDNARVIAEYLLSKGYELSGGGTVNHLILVKRPRGLSGKCAQLATELVGITTNKNAVPNDEASMHVTSGMRLGAPAITTRGIKEDEARDIARIIDTALFATQERKDHSPIMPERIAAGLKGEVSEICKAHPIYTGLIVQFEYIRKVVGL